ncbi:C40 family peptidase [Pseudonocardia spirodelae]|uniref:C40 family peptidase n=1 Tax=Pseudonocardia spirodelae TaxID=3133431 RepID=A0ABU8TDW0_9PSEU
MRDGHGTRGRARAVLAAVAAGLLLLLAGAPPASAAPDPRAAVAVSVALRQVGVPYAWGGGDPARGFDCSGLVRHAWAGAGVALPRTAHDQYRFGARIPAGAAPEPGDLVFYGTVDKVHHVGLYVGQDRMVHAPAYGQPVRTAWYRWRGDDFLGATRPTAGVRTVADPAVRETPDPAIPDEPVLDAPPAPPPSSG